jgi:hypothetical protein
VFSAAKALKERAVNERRMLAKRVFGNGKSYGDHKDLLDEKKFIVYGID